MADNKNDLKKQLIGILIAALTAAATAFITALVQGLQGVDLTATASVGAGGGIWAYVKMLNLG